MTTLSRDPSKAEEIAHYNEYVDALPRASYLAGILRDTRQAVAELITNDMAFPDPLLAIWETNVMAARELADKRSRLQNAKRELSRLEMRCSSKRGELRDLAASADLIGKHIRQACPA